MNNLVCKNCGHIALYIGTDFYDEKCELCGQEMYPQIDTEKQEIEKLVNTNKEFFTIEKIIEMDLIRGMEDNIKSVGHKRTWECIERIKNAKQRIVFRQGFFKAGGRI